MTKYEYYLYTTIGYKSEDFDRDNHHINELGADGWELVSVLKGNDVLIVYAFKRPLLD